MRQIETSRRGLLRHGLAGLGSTEGTFFPNPQMAHPRSREAKHLRKTPHTFTAHDSPNEISPGMPPLSARVHGVLRAACEQSAGHWPLGLRHHHLIINLVSPEVRAKLNPPIHWSRAGFGGGRASHLQERRLERCRFGPATSNAPHTSSRPHRL
jgi:hypothetical protein